MEKIVYYDYSAFVVLVILLLSIVLRKMTRGRRNRCFLLLVLVVMAAVIADVAAINYGKLGAGNVAGKYVAHTLYLFFHCLLPVVYFAYLITLTDTWHRVLKYPALWISYCIPMLAVTLLLIANPATGHIFYLDGQESYTRGKLFYILYVVSAIYVIIGLAYMLFYRRLFKRGKYLTLISVYPLMAVSVVIQFFLPHYIIELFANSIGVLLIFMMIQRPEDKIDTATGLSKLSAYVHDMRRMVEVEKPVKVIMVNVTNYKSLRDMLGYDATNELLLHVADDLRALNWNQHFGAELYYLGVGKFRLVAEKQHFEQVEAVANQINDMLKPDYKLNGMELNMVACVCITRYPEDINNVDALLAFGNDLDAKYFTGSVLYASEIYRPEHYNLMRDLEGIMERAFANRAFSVYYQPIYSVQEQRFNSAEALLRLYDEKYGFISPEIFIPVAERNGAIHKIGAFVLEEVCRFIASDTFRSLGIDYIEVNLSVAQCMRTNLAQEILEILERYHVSPSQINLEITETATSYSQNAMMENLDVLSRAGVTFSLDDFGSGYSNMRRIASLPIHIVKLDKSFISEQGNPNILIVLENTIRMIKDMNMKIVVEGVETKGLAKQFSDLQCEYIQGYYYSRPIPKDEFVQFIENAG